MLREDKAGGYNVGGGWRPGPQLVGAAGDAGGASGKARSFPKEPHLLAVAHYGHQRAIVARSRTCCCIMPPSPRKFIRSGIAPSRAHSTSSTERGPQHPSPAAGTLADRPTMAPFHLQDFPCPQDDGIRAWPPGLGDKSRSSLWDQEGGAGSGALAGPAPPLAAARFPHCPPPSTAPRPGFPHPNPSGFLTRPQTRRLLAIWALSHFSSGRCEPGSAKGPSLRVSLEAGGHEKD